MRNWAKKILLVGIVILIGVFIEYLNSMFVHNVMVWLFNFVFVVGTITMTLGLFWNLDREEIASYNALEEHKNMGEKQSDAKTYLRKRYIDNELSDEEYTGKMARL